MYIVLFPLSFLFSLDDIEMCTVKYDQNTGYKIVFHF